LRPLLRSYKKTQWILLILLVIGSTVLFTVNKKKNRTLLITGCARSGTTYIAKILQEGGLQVGHEYVGKDGTSSWDLAARPKEGRWKVRLENYRFAHIFHQTRHPLKVISSVYLTEDQDSWDYIRTYVPEIRDNDSHLTKCAKYWYYWNLKAEAMSEWTYRIEEIDNLLGEFERRLGKKIDHSALERIPRNTNTKGTPPNEFSWEDLQKELDTDLYQKICSLAEKYGYTY
jgi:hypothetical protein